MAMLRVDLRDLRAGPVPTDGMLEPDDLALAGLGLAFVGPVAVEGELQETGEGDLLWRGHLRARVTGECRRCIEPVETVLDEAVDVLFSSDPELLDDPSVYPVEPDTDMLDVTSAVREELALRISAFPLCRPDCKGLCARCGADLNAGPCQCTAAATTN